MIKLIYKNILFFLIFLIFFLILSEIFLKLFAKNYQLNSNSPFFISSYYRDLDKKINKTGFIDKLGFRIKENNRDLLSDLYNHVNNDLGCSIVVLGDSFVWGDGIKSGERWVDKLDGRNNCKIFPFGKNGWSSLDMFNFHEKYLKKINYSILVIGIVSNDLHLNNSYDIFKYDEKSHQQIYFGSYLPYFIRPIYQKIYDYSDILYIIDKSINKILQNKKSQGVVKNKNIKSWGYNNWLKYMYKDDIFLEWEKIVSKFYKNNNKKNKIFFLQLSNKREIKYFDKIHRFLSEKNFKNIYCRKKLINNSMISRKDWANPANGHPGNKTIEAYVNCLEENLYQFIGKK